MMVDVARARGTIKGTGEETKEIDNPITKQHEVVHSYGWYLRQFVAGARAKGATPVICSLIPRKIWNAGKIVRAKEGYASWAEAVAKATDAGTLISVGGGGDTVSALRAAGVAELLTYLSSAGGAFLEWMEGKTLPGVAALNA